MALAFTDRSFIEAKSIPVPEAGCWLWTGRVDRRGYGVLVIQGKERAAHRLSWAAHNGGLEPDGLHVCHKCDTPGCVNPTHLFSGTHKDNAMDRNRKGRGCTLANGTRFSTKYSDEQIEDVRRLAASGRTQKAIAKKHGMCRSYVHYLVARRSRYCAIGVKQ